MENSELLGQSALRKGRFSEPNGIYFITFVTLQRIPWFQEFEFAAAMCRTLNNPGSVQAASMLCYVVMPDHVHALLQLGEKPLPVVIRTLKSVSASALNRSIGRSGGFWQAGYYDHALRKEEDLVGIARYIVANPLRSKLVAKVGDYPYWNAIWL